MEIKPISYLRNTQELTKLCDKGEAVYLTKNGHKALTILSSEKYDKILAELDFHKKMMEASEDVIAGRVYNLEDVISELNKKYGF
ncbi:MAG: prevent-host-death protein [Candidatus Dojkabacteria bacterium]|jgi:PHD/YefM family antitoxin component YafN of YafNO toxin-antitoxin module